MFLTDQLLRISEHFYPYPCLILVIAESSTEWPMVIHRGKLECSTNWDICIVGSIQTWTYRWTQKRARRRTQSSAGLLHSNNDFQSNSTTYQAIDSFLQCRASICTERELYNPWKGSWEIGLHLQIATLVSCFDSSFECSTFGLTMESM